MMSGSYSSPARMYEVATHIVSAPGGFRSDTTSFKNLIAANGGTISPPDLKAIDQFVRTCRTAGLKTDDALSPILHFSPLAGDDLNAAKAKLWSAPGEGANLTLLGYSASDYSRTTGIQHGSGKVIKSGFIPINYFSGNPNSAGLGVYVRSAGTAGFTVDAGAQTVDNQTADLMVYADSTNGGFLCWNGYNGAIAASMGGSNLGLLFGSRVSSSDFRFYRNAVQLAIGTTTAGSPPSNQLFFGSNNDSDNYPSGRYNCNRSHGCYMVTRGLTAAQTLVLTQAVNTLMNAFGRGVV